MIKKIKLSIYALVILTIFVSCSPVGQHTAGQNSSLLHEEIWEDTISNEEWACTISAKIRMPSTGTYTINTVERSLFSLYDFNNLFSYFVKMEPSNFDLLTGETILLKNDDHENIHTQLYDDFIYFAFYPLQAVIQFEQWLRDDDEYCIEQGIPTKIINIKITQNEAQKQCEDIISDLSISNIYLASTDKARIVFEENDIAQVISEGWYFVYTYSSNNYIPTDILRFKPNGNMQFPISSSYAPWDLERIRFYVDQDGIKYFEWSNRLNIVKTDIVPEILSVDKTKELIKRHIVQGYSGIKVPEDERPILNEVSLTNLLLKNDDDDNQAILTPAWMVRFTSRLYRRENIDDFVFFLNAITGERIDPHLTPDIIEFLQQYIGENNAAKNIE